MAIECTKCGHELAIEAFYIYRKTEKVRQPCKICHSRLTNAYRQNPINKQKRNQQHRDRYHSDVAYRKHQLQQSKRVRRKNYLKGKFNLTQDDVKLMVQRQENRCLICLECFDDDKMIPCIDHCHITGKVRGILCPLCNKGIGLLKDDPERLLRASDYLKGYLNAKT